MLYLTFITPFRAKPRPSKKARLDKAAEEDAVPEPDKTRDLEAAIREDILSDFGFRQTLEVRTLGCARRLRLLLTCAPPPRKDLNYRKNSTRDTRFILVRATIVV